MKKIFTLFAASLFTLAAFAGGDRPGSMLTVQSQGKGNLKVMVDGRYFEPYDNFMRLRGLYPGDHQVKIIQEKTNFFYGTRRDIVYNGILCVKPGTQVTLFVDRFGRTTKTESGFNGYYSWNDRGRYHDNDGFDRDDHGRYQNGYDNRHDYDFDTRDRDDQDGYDNRDNRGYGNNHGGYGNGQNGGYGNGQNGGYGNGQNGGYGNGNNGGYNGGGQGGYYGGGRMNEAMSDRDFNQLIQNLDKEWFENNKIKSVTQVISGNYFTVAQVKQLVLEFNFDDNKLSVAKMAYTHTIDKGNYYIISDLLTFSSSKDELDRYMRTTR